MQRVLPNLFLIATLSMVSAFKSDPSFAKAPTAKTLLWEISGNGLNQPSYLLGTRHAGCAKRLALSPEQSQALTKVAQVYLEVDEKELNLFNDTPQTAGERRPPDGKGPKERLTSSQYQFVEDYFGKGILDSFVSRGMSILNLYGIVSSDLAVKVYDRFCKDSFTSKESVIKKAAANRQLPMLGIETQKERQDILNRFSSKDNKLSQDEVNSFMNIIHIANYVSSNSIHAEAQFEYYIKSDEQYFYQDIAAIDRESSRNAFSDALVVGRNKFWLPRMVKAMNHKPTLFAFGWGHLGGDEGLISILKSRGYNLKPVFSSMKPEDVNGLQVDNSRAKEYYEAGQQDSDSSNYLDALNNYSRAIEIWNRNSSKDPERANAYYNRALLKINHFCGFKSSLADLNKAISLNPNYELAYLQRGILRQKLHDYQGALLDFNRVIALVPDLKSGPYYYRAILKSDHLNDPKGALADFDTFLTSEPQDGLIFMLRGILKYTRLSDQSGGIADLRRAALLLRNKGEQENLNRVLLVLKTLNVSETP